MKIKLIIACLILGLFVFINISAQETQEPNINFPVSELGNCSSKEKCKTFCDNPDNIRVCVDFAEKHNLMSKDEVKRARKVVELGSGPGGCRGKDACEKFCSTPENIEVCIEFAEKHDLVDKKQIEEGRKVAKALKEGANLPGGCKDKSTCEAYCSDTAHSEECLNFAEKAGFIPKEELERARKFLPLMQRGETPGACKTKDQCETYCHQEGNIQECAEFGLKVGAMSQEEYDRFKKTGGKGPGSCKGQNECEAFCNNPENQEQCLSFAEEHGFMKKGRVEEVREGSQQLKDHFTNMPSEVKSCIESAIGADKFSSIRNGEINPGPELGKAMRQCFESMAQQNKEDGQNQNGEPRDGGIMMRGPGGCSSPEECRKYCQDNEEECHRPQPMPRQEQEQNQNPDQNAQQKIREGAEDGFKPRGEERYRKEMMPMQDQGKDGYRPMGSYMPPKPPEEYNRPPMPQENDLEYNRMKEMYRPEMHEQQSGESYQKPPEGYPGPEQYQMPPQNIQTEPQPEYQMPTQQMETAPQPQLPAPTSLLTNSVLGVILKVLLGY